MTEAANQSDQANKDSGGIVAQASDRLHSAADSTRSALGGLPDAIEANPLIALLGGLAIGAIAGALLPRSERESELLAPLGGRVADAVRNAGGAAREAGFASLDEAGISKDAARDQVNKLIETATAAAREAAGAAFKAVREG